jgi:hypothetical protein
LALLGHSGVKGALVVGQARLATAVILELEDELSRKVQSRDERDAMLDTIWPFILEANKSAPSHAQLARDKVIFSDPDKPFFRLPKGTVQRKSTTNLYGREIDELYADANKEDLENVPRIDLSENKAGTEAAIGSLIEAIINTEKVSPEQDFFALGMDSLHVMRLSRQLEAVLEGKYQADKIARLIYGHASVSALTEALRDSSKGVNGVSSEVAVLKTLKRFTEQLPPRDGLVVVLTGSTGSLGSYLLHSLAVSKTVARVYCLNRRPDADLQQAKTNESRGLVSDWGERVIFLHADLSKPKLGLSQQDYDSLRTEASVVIRKSGLIYL